MNSQQRTLTGGEADRVECTCHGDVCNRPAKYRGEPLVYDGLGWGYEERLFCESCAEEYTEQGTDKSKSDDLERLKPAERFNTVVAEVGGGGS